MKNIRAEELMAAYLSGNITSTEKDELMGWVSETSHGQDFFDKAVSLWSATENMAYPDFSASKAAAWDKVEGRLDANSGLKAIGGGATVRRLNLRSWVAAAAIALLAVAGWWYMQQPAVPTAVIASTLNEEQEELLLPDGTKVWLNENTYLTYEELDGERQLRLEGEAFFDVATDSLRPFRIYTDQAVTTVLGTSFNIRAYPEEEQVEVSVKEGKVQLERLEKEETSSPDPDPAPAAAPIVLEQGEQGVFEKQTAKLAAKEKTGKNSAAWRDRKMDFNQLELSEVVQTIERLYEVEIELANPGLAKCPFVGKYDNPTLEDLFESLAFALEGEVENKDGVYRLTGDSCE
ncbi:MAG: FecR domain-containing protein [Bacteroidota bacterium]